MECVEIRNLSVAEIMNRWSETIGVFINLKMKCVGCPLARHCSLQDACEHHDVPLARANARIAAAIERPIRAGPAPRRHRSTEGDAGS
jgi:hybrid cluster-associated redox disulfide protein